MNEPPTVVSVCRSLPSNHTQNKVMRICSYCRTHLTAEANICPDCGRAVRQSEDLTTAPDPSPPPPQQHWLAFRRLPGVQNAWSERGVEIGFILGTGLTFCIGVYSIVEHTGPGGVITLLCSPLCGLLVALGFGTSLELLQAFWHLLTNEQVPERLPAHRALAKTDSLHRPSFDDPRTDICSLTRQQSIQETPDPVVEPSEAPPVSSGNEETVADPAPINDRGLFLKIFVAQVLLFTIVGLGITMGSIGTVLVGTLCLGVPTGFLLGVRLARRRRRKSLQPQEAPPHAPPPSS